MFRIFKDRRVKTLAGQGLAVQLIWNLSDNEGFATNMSVGKLWVYRIVIIVCLKNVCLYGIDFQTITTYFVANGLEILELKLHSQRPSRTPQITNNHI